VARFSNAALSGGTSSRPGYQSLLRAARSREIGIIVTEDRKRVARRKSGWLASAITGTSNAGAAFSTIDVISAS
jgi:DNA invertase Pin-like site-specific DNA recombinase